MRHAVESLLVLVGVLAVLALGGAAIVLGEADDSPGLQGIGVLVVIGATAAALRLRWGRGPHRPAGDPPPVPPGQVPDAPRRVPR